MEGFIVIKATRYGVAAALAGLALAIAPMAYAQKAPAAATAKAPARPSGWA